jgi:Leucine rich repeat
MRPIVGVFLISLLFAVNAVGQKDKLYKGLKQALEAPADSVYRLDLSKSKLTEIPSEIYAFKNLRELNLSKNKLTDLPTGFLFSNLRILDLSRNLFSQFPTAICKNKSIRNLFMGKNKIKTIPECIGELENLIVFDIWFNPIEDLPESMTKLRNLRSLDLSGISFNKTQQKKWSEMLSWVKIEFEAACDCNN